MPFIGAVFGAAMAALKGYIIAYNAVRIGVAVKKFFGGRKGGVV